MIQMRSILDVADNSGARKISVINPIGGSTASGKIQVVDAQTIAGWEITNNWANNRPTYFVARFSKPFDTKRVAFSADGFKAYLTFADGHDSRGAAGAGACGD